MKRWGMAVVAVVHMMTPVLTGCAAQSAVQRLGYAAPDGVERAPAQCEVRIWQDAVAVQANAEVRGTVLVRQSKCDTRALHSILRAEACHLHVNHVSIVDRSESDQCVTTADLIMGHAEPAVRASTAEEVAGRAQIQFQAADKASEENTTLLIVGGIGLAIVAGVVAGLAASAGH